MSVQHHLDQATLVRHASGDLDEAFSIVVASHLAMCGTCRRAARRAESIGGELLQNMEQVPMQQGAFDRLMKQIDDGHGVGATVPQTMAVVAGVPGDIPLPLQRHVGNSLGDISWKFAAPGVRKRTIKLMSDTGSSLYMLRIAAGMAVPEHGHGGSEMTLVLSGAYRDDMGVYAAGDIEDLDEHVEHQPIVLPEVACICLVATESPAKFKGLFSRMLQPLVGI
jgi:putative transcriptional regulator